MGPEKTAAKPNITAVQSACSLLKISWDDATVVSLHGRAMAKLVEVLGQARKIIVYTTGADTPGEIARPLQRPGLPAYRMCVLDELGEKNQKFAWLSPAEAGKQIFSALNLVGPLGQPTENLAGLHPGLPKRRWHMKPV